MLTARRTSTFTESVIREMTRLSVAHGAINLSQGFPDFPMPAPMTKEITARCHSCVAPASESTATTAYVVVDVLDERDLTLGGRAVRRTARHRCLDRLEDGRVGVAEQHRPPRADQVDIGVVVDVGQPRAGGGADEAGRATDGVEGAHRRVDPARCHGTGSGEERLGTGDREFRHRAIVADRPQRLPIAGPRLGWSPVSG